MYNISYRSERVSDLHLSEGCFGIRTILLAMTDDQAVSKKVADYYFSYYAFALYCPWNGWWVNTHCIV
jgi:hypothetical protein